jgi:hemerythrin-like domain-containing protein
MVTEHTSAAHADVRLYRIVHDTFRLMTTRFVDATEKLEPSALVPIIGSRWTAYAALLHEHHHNEDDSIFPALVAAKPDMNALVTRLGDDHQQLIAAMESVDAAIAAFDASPDRAHQKTLHDALVAVRDLFFPHLDTEDEQILPAIAESIPPKEWERLDKAALKEIPRQYLPTAVAALDEVIRDLPKEEQPPPPPLPIRLMLALSWRKKYSAWVEPLVV